MKRRLLATCYNCGKRHYYNGRDGFQDGSYTLVRVHD